MTDQNSGCPATEQSSSIHRFSTLALHQVHKIKGRIAARSPWGAQGRLQVQDKETPAEALAWQICLSTTGLHVGQKTAAKGWS